MQTEQETSRRRRRVKYPVQLAFRVNPDTKSCLDAEADRRGDNVSDVCRDILEAWVKRQQKKSAIA